eukprot:4958326-Pleurochrysis_carterae.AAC.2
MRAGARRHARAHALKHARTNAHHTKARMHATTHVRTRLRARARTHGTRSNALPNPGEDHWMRESSRRRTLDRTLAGDDVRRDEGLGDLGTTGARLPGRAGDGDLLLGEGDGSDMELDDRAHEIGGTPPLLCGLLGKGEEALLLRMIAVSRTGGVQYPIGPACLRNSAVNQVAQM